MSKNYEQYWKWFEKDNFSDEFKDLINHLICYDWKWFEKDNFSDEFKDLINHLICYDPAERFSIDEILEHPWIVKNTNYSECEIKNKDSNEFRCFVDEDVIEELKYRRSFIEKKIR